MDSIISQLAFIGFLGIAAQWLAWRFKLPAIVLLLIAGFAVGPLFGLVNPAADFGAIYKPVIALAVSVILFEGGLTLKWSDISETSTAVRRIIYIGGPLVWLGSLLSAHYIGGLEWPTAIIMGAILVITGPTVIMPLLRNARLTPRPASILRWEAIINDPIGALYAVIAFEVFLIFFANYSGDGYNLAPNVFITYAVGALLFATLGGFAIARGLVWAFRHAMVPEYLKAPVLLAVVIGAFAVSDLLLKESGLLTVTIMGVVMANSRFASLTEMRRFKETVTVLLVSGLFIMLTASLELATFAQLDWGAAGFVSMVLFVVRPVAIYIATIGAGLTNRERLLVGWIAPRGIVAVAVSGLFGATLVDAGVADGEIMIAYTFAVVAATIVLHGFSLNYLAKILDLKSADKPGILMVGGSSWSNAFATKLQEAGVPVLIADRNWSHVQKTRMDGVEAYYGEVLSEAAHHNIDLNKYSHLIAATDNDYYNALICSDFGPETGRSNVFQIGTLNETAERHQINFTIGGRPLTRPGHSLSDLRLKLINGWTFRSTKLTGEFGHEDLKAQLPPDAIELVWIDSNGGFRFPSMPNLNKPDVGATVVTFTPTQATDGE
ncbi:MAG: sodium:proton antiporter [Pseudomonadota bacterium]